MEKTDKPRILYLDAARCAAIFLIALNHAVNRTWDNYEQVQQEFAMIGPASTILKAMLTIASRYGVPLFLMITGALLLNRRFDTKEEVRSFYRHNWLSVFITGEIWTFFGFWFFVLFKPYNAPLAGASAAEKLWGCVKTLLFLDPVRFDSMWYVPMILSVYLIIPIVAWTLYRAPAPRLLLLPLAGAFLCDMLLPMINDWLAIFGHPKMNFVLYDSNFVSVYLIYIVAGWQISRGGLEKLSNRALVLITALSYLGCCAVQYYCYSCSTHLLAYMSPAILFSSFFVFECFRRWAGLLRRWEKPMAAVSRSAFALYLIHVFFVWGIHWYMYFTGWHRSAKLLFMLFVPLGLSGLIIWPLSKIPFCRKYLFLIK